MTLWGKQIDFSWIFIAFHFSNIFFRNWIIYILYIMKPKILYQKFKLFLFITIQSHSFSVLLQFPKAAQSYLKSHFVRIYSIRLTVLTYLFDTFTYYIHKKINRWLLCLKLYEVYWYYFVSAFIKNWCSFDQGVHFEIIRSLVSLQRVVSNANIVRCNWTVKMNFGRCKLLNQPSKL